MKIPAYLKELAVMLACGILAAELAFLACIFLVWLGTIRP